MTSNPLDNQTSDPDLGMSWDEWIQGLFTVPVRGNNQQVKWEIPVEASTSSGPHIHEEIDGGEMKYEAAEHNELGDSINLYSIDGTPSPSPHVILASIEASGGPPIDLNFGEFVFLGGDFYTTHGKKYAGKNATLGSANEYKNIEFDDGLPISGAYSDRKNATDTKTMEARFLSAVDSLLGDSDGLLRGIIDAEKVEAEGVKAAQEQNGQVHIAYHDHSCGIPTDDVWRSASSVPLLKALKGGLGQALKSWTLYGWISFYNADHFGNDALTAYSVGHGLALRKAKEAHAATTDVKKQELLKMSYIIEGFACHFLTDLFSSGHLRAPRRLIHCPNSAEMAAYYKLGRPVYDVQCRLFHDEDAAIGLLVKNKKGEQWIAYGDKELSMAPNGFNKSKIIHCVQASVDEVFKQGFKEGAVLSQDKYAALQLIPQPMPAIENDEWQTLWDGFDRHNFKPLWRLTPTNSNGSQIRGTWKTRGSIDDRSLADMVSGSFTSSILQVPSIVPSPELKRCEEISRKLSSDDLYQNISELRPDTGGFIQIQQLVDANDHGVNPKGLGSQAESQLINVWGPVRYQKGDQFKYIFTLRNRLSNFDRIIHQDSVMPIHWMKYYDTSTKKTSIFRFDYLKGPTPRISVSGWSLYSPIPSLHSDSQIVSYNPVKNWDFVSEKLSLQQTTLMKNDAAGWLDGCLNLTRFFLLRLPNGLNVANTSNKAHHIVSTSFIPPADKTEKAITKVCILPMDQPSNKQASSATEIILHNEYTTPPTFVKALKNVVKDAILHVRFIQSAEKSIVSLDVLAMGERGSIDAMKSDFPIYTNASKHPIHSVLTGNIYGVSGNKTDILILSGESGGLPMSSLQVFNYDFIQKSITTGGSHECNLTSLTLSSSYIKSHFVALLESEANKASIGLDVLNVYVSKTSKGSYNLNFRVHRRNAQDPSSNRLESASSTNIWTDCKETQLPDTLFSNPNYESIKWIRCKFKTSKNAIMEIFSLHGILGCRAFYPKDRGGYLYTPCGVHPFMGQTATGMGRGCYGDWGYGFMTWGNNLDFVDISIDNGMSLEDMKRDTVRGWQVEKTE